MPVGNLPGWRQIFSDDFDTPVPLGQFPQAVSSKWSAYPDGWRNTPGAGTYMPSKVVSIHDGMLDKWIHTENGVHMIAALLPKLAPGANAYWGSGLVSGRYAIRFKADALDRYKTAWLLWPDSGAWPRDGEIDFPEGELDGVIKAFMHRQGATTGGDQNAYVTTARYTDWHTAVIEWRPDLNSCKFFLDGVLVGNPTTRVPNTKMHWVIQTETELPDPDPDNATQGHVYIDWVAVWVPMTQAEQKAILLSELAIEVERAQETAGALDRILAGLIDLD